MRTCTKCGRPNDDRAKFCGGCGTKVAPAAAPAPSATAPAADDDEFAALFRVSEAAAAASSDDLFGTPSRAAPASPPPPAPGPRRPADLGAEELEKLFEETSGAADTTHEPIDDLFADAAPLSARPPDSFAGPGKDDGLDDAFNKLLEQRAAEERAAATSPNLDASSPGASLADRDDILAEARRELERGTTPDPFAAARASAPASKAPAPDEKDDYQEGWVEEPADETPPPVEADEPAASADEAEEPDEARAIRQPRRGRAAPLPSALIRSRLAPPPTFVGRVSSLLALLALAAATGDSLRSVMGETALWPVAAVPAAALVLAWLLKRLAKAERQPLGLLSTVLLGVLVAIAFDPSGSLPRTAVFMGLPAARFQPYVLTWVLVAALFMTLRCVLLHRAFRLVLAVLGVYGFTGLIQGIAAGQDLTTIIGARLLVLAPAASPPELVRQLSAAFEPTFLAANLFLPLVTIALAFEAVKLGLNRLAAPALTVAAGAALLAGTLAVTVGVYDAAGVPSLRSLVRGIAAGRPPLTLLVRETPPAGITPTVSTAAPSPTVPPTGAAATPTKTPTKPPSKPPKTP